MNADENEHTAKREHSTLPANVEKVDRPPTLVLIGQSPLLQSLTLSINEEIRSRATYPVVLPRLAPETIEAFILGQLDRAGLGPQYFHAQGPGLDRRFG